jgi:hypothetical protein
VLRPVWPTDRFFLVDGIPTGMTLGKKLGLGPQGYWGEII